MRRNLILLLALLLPTLVYWLYVRVEQKRAGVKASKAWWITAPWPKLVSASALLLAAVLLSMTFLNKAPRTGVYQPAQVIDGRLVHGHMELKPAELKSLIPPTMTAPPANRANEPKPVEHEPAE